MIDLSSADLTNALIIAATLVALPSFIYFLWDRYKPISLKILESPNPPFFTRFYAPTNLNHGHPCICIFNMEILNNSGRPLAIREILVQYKYQGKILIEDSHVILTSLVHSTIDHRNTKCAVLDGKNAHIVMMDWNNIKSSLYAKDRFDDGEVIKGSACFVLSQNITPEEVQDLHMVVKTHKGKSYKIPIKRPTKDERIKCIRNEQFEMRDGELMISGALSF